jgi:hypothetical protein
VAAAGVGGHTLIDFAYSDSWQPRTDGDGYSLVPRDPSAAPEAWENPARWRHSRAAGGTPGAADPGPADAVAGRWMFYNRSLFDGTNGLFADSSDDNATARDKRALLPGERSSGANYSSYTRGINGLFIDLANLAHGATLTAADFVFRIGTSGDPSTWQTPQMPNLVAIRRGAGALGSDRVTIGWPDSVIRNTWLQVTVLANSRTGLSSPDVFYFGHLQGDAGNTPVGAPRAVVDVRDEAILRGAMSRALVNGSNPLDFDHNGVVSSLDLMTSRRAARTSLPMFIAPGGAPAAFSDVPVGGDGQLPQRSAPSRRRTLATIDVLAIS